MAGQDGIGTVFAIFLRLGLTSFGGPIAHLGYFRDEFVRRRRWLDDAAYADLVALCQFLPGPASSQAGFALGYLRAGLPGALAAWAGFTLPSAMVMAGLALLTGTVATGAVGAGALAGLKIVAVAIVAQAVLGMARTLCPDRARAAIAVAAVAVLAVLPGAAGMLAAIAGGALAGLGLGSGRRDAAATPGFQVPTGLAVAAALGVAVLLVLLPLVAGLSPVLALTDAFARAGALVFGGGHVVLPLLQAELVATGRVPADAFLAGYGAAQAVPGPLFTFAAYLGALIAPGGAQGAALALAAIFLPGMLLLLAALPVWQSLRALPAAQGAMAGANAAVVGVLGAALHDPVFTGGVKGAGDFALALAGFVALTAWKVPPWAVVAALAAAGALRGALG